jgi:glycine betaine catabolism A
VTALDAHLADLRKRGDNPVAHARTLPGAAYSDPEHFQLELRRIFRHDWIAIGLDTDVAAPGSFLTGFAGDAPVLVTRDEAGRLRAFLNVCRHRGAPLAEGCGEARALRCPYHSWVFRLDGSLARATGVGSPADFDPADYGLFEIGVTTFARSVFVNLDTNAEDFDAGPLAVVVAPYALHELELGRRERYEAKFNWKVLVENYSENYHTPSIHAQLITSGYEYPTLCRDRLVVAWDRPLHPRDPSEQALHDHTPLEPEWSSVTSSMAPESFNNGAYITCYPNMMISMFAGYAATFRLRPTSPNTTIIERDFLWSSDVSSERRERDYVATKEVVQQDLDICEALQRTYDAGLSAEGVLSTDHEGSIAHLHHLLAGSLAPPTRS